MCPRCSVAGAWSRLGALGCWRSDGAVFATFQQLEIGTMYSVHGLLGANIVIFEWIVHKAINPVCNTCFTNAGLLPVVEKRKGSFFSVQKWGRKKVKGGF